MRIRIRRIALFRLRKRRSGQAMVEFALIAAILVFLLLGVFEFGEAWRAYQTVADATREGGRIAVEYRPGISADSVALAANRIMQNAGLDTTVAVKTLTPNAVPNTAQCTTFQISYPYRMRWLTGPMGLVGNAATINMVSHITFRNEYQVPAGAPSC